MKMLKHSVIAALVLTLAVTGVAIGFMPGSVSADIESHDWLNTTYEGWDDFFGSNVIAYQEGNSATLIARVYNDRGTEISIDYGRLDLDWATTPLEATDKPNTIAAGEWALFTWQMDIPSVSTASNLILHPYKITVQYDMPENADRQWVDFGYNLAIYSEDQANCRDLINQWNANNTNYTFWGYEGRQAMTEAWYIFNKATSEYKSADFDQAKTDYEAALTKQADAMKKDSGIALTDESALTLEGTGGVKGIGFLIGGIGILVLGVAAGLGILAWAFLKR